jgi:hypothetical protein
MISGVDKGNEEILLELFIIGEWIVFVSVWWQSCR